MTVSLYVRVVVKGKRRYVPVNKKKLYPDGTVFCLRYSRRWETLPTDDLSTALAARALKEAALLTERQSSPLLPMLRVLSASVCDSSRCMLEYCRCSIGNLHRRQT